jgi:hypothetical protein
VGVTCGGHTLHDRKKDPVNWINACNLGHFIVNGFDQISEHLAVANKIASVVSGYLQLSFKTSDPSY